MINYLKPLAEAEMMGSETLSFFSQLKENQLIDIMASFEVYDFKNTSFILTSQLYRYHVFNLCNNDEFNDLRLIELSQVFELSKYEFFDKIGYLIKEPYMKVSFDNIGKWLEKCYEETHKNQQKEVTLYKGGQKWLGILVPLSQIVRLEFTFRTCFKNAIESVEKEFPRYKNELIGLLNEVYKIPNPDFKNFIDWVMKDRFDYNPIIDIEDKGNQHAKIHFDFRPLLSLSDSRLKNEIIEYCRHVNHTFKQQILKDAVNERQFLAELLKACQKLQLNITYHADQLKGKNDKEDSRNRFIRDLLSQNGWEIRDQSQQGISSKGKKSGEIDLLLMENGTPKIIIEALNLSSINSTNTDLSVHIKKLEDNYDQLGLSSCSKIVYRIM